MLLAFDGDDEVIEVRFDDVIGVEIELDAGINVVVCRNFQFKKELLQVILCTVIAQFDNLHACNVSYLKAHVEFRCDNVHRRSILRVVLPTSTIPQLAYYLACRILRTLRLDVEIPCSQTSTGPVGFFRWPRNAES